jgi:hypothetical protein
MHGRIDTIRFYDTPYEDRPPSIEVIPPQSVIPEIWNEEGLYRGIVDMGKILDEQDVPVNDRWVWVNNSTILELKETPV